MITRVPNSWKITTWDEAYKKNYALCPPFSMPLSRRDRALIRPFVAFIQEQQCTRHQPETNNNWQRLTLHRSADPEHYYFRDASYDFRFDLSFSPLFNGKRVLDIGCRSMPGILPLYKHYRNMGAISVGIDLLSIDDPIEGVFQGDVRMLSFADASFDFITYPWIFGFDCPSNTILEIVAGLSELYRACNNGLIHSSEMGYPAEILYIASLLGFRFFKVSRPDTICINLPAGHYFIKGDQPFSANPFASLIETHLLPAEITPGKLVLPPSQEDHPQINREHVICCLRERGELSRDNLLLILNQLFDNPGDIWLHPKLRTNELDEIQGRIDRLFAQGKINEKQREFLENYLIGEI